MPQGYENWGDRSDKAKTAKIERSLAQDQGRRIKKEIVDALYSEKIINNVDIGAVCSFWAYKITTNLSVNDGELQDRLLRKIDRAYQRGRDPMTYRRFQRLWRKDGLKSIARKINEFKQIPKLSFMGGLDKPKEKSTRYDDENW